MDKKHQFRLYFFTGLTLMIMVAIFMLSAQQGSDSKGLSEWLYYSPFGQFLMKVLPRLSDHGLDADIRKYAHMFEYGVLGISCTYMFKEYRYPKKLNLSILFLVSVGFVFLYGATDEIHQLYVPGRSGCFTDVLVDTFGGFLGIVYSLLWIKKEVSRNEK